MLKSFFNFIPSFKRRIKFDGSKSAVGVWVIKQMIKCPYCETSFDIIQTNLKRKSNQGTMKITQKQVTRYDKDKFEYSEMTTEIPTPPYFGALLEDTENLDEHIKCVSCDHDILVTETNWRYGD